MYVFDGADRTKKFHVKHFGTIGRQIRTKSLETGPAVRPAKLPIAVRGACMVAAAMLEGLPPNSAAHVMRLSCGEAAARRIADIIVETFDPATTAAAAFEETPDTAGSKDAPWVVEAYFGKPA